jgi:hypothetical protein
MTSKKVRIIFFSFLLAILFFANVSQAALVTCGGHNDDGTVQPACTIPDLIKTVLNIINFLLSWAWLVAVIFIVWAGWGMIGAGGNEEEVTKAKATLSNAIIGFFIIMASFVLVNWAVSLLTGNGIPRAGTLIQLFNLLNINP